jgi:amino acid transporter
MPDEQGRGGKTGGGAGGGPNRRRGLTLWNRIVGPPVRADQLGHEEITSPEGLAALSLDALSSVAYGPQALLSVLAVAGAAAFGYVVPITLAICALLAILVLSYRQVIDAYPSGGGAYTVSKENLGDAGSRLAGAALIVDYVLTVAVSVSAGIAALTSAFPGLTPWTIPLNLAMLALITYTNLRGVGDSARAFLLPTFLFIAGILLVIAVGLARHAPPPVVSPRQLAPVGVFLVLKAFAAGTSALTGVEAIANGVPLFREPRVQRAKVTETMLGIILGIMLIGLAVLVVRFHVMPTASQTVLSELIRHAVGSSWLYYVIALSVTAVLGLAANTSYGGLPLLLSLLARDNLVPHLFGLRGDRYVFQWGIWVLTILAAVLLIVFDGDPNALVSLFAIGVFTGFTLSQAGMVVHWRSERSSNWRVRAVINGVGAVATGLSTIVFAVAKFSEGAWVVLVAVPLILLGFRYVRRYYASLARTLRLDQTPLPPTPGPILVVVLVDRMSAITREALSEALSMSDDVLAVSVRFDEDSEKALEQAWEVWNPGVRLVTVRSQYRSVVRPIVRFAESLEKRPGRRTLVLIPEIVPNRPWQAFLHNQMGVILTQALRSHTDLTVARLPIHVPEADEGGNPGNRGADSS